MDEDGADEAERLTEAIDGRSAWPEAEGRYRLELTEPDEPVGMDVFATVLDLTPRSPETVVVDIELGRRDTLTGDRQTALERLAANPGVTAGSDRTRGTAPATVATVDALARLPGDALTHAVALDGNRRAIVERRTRTTVRFALPETGYEDAAGQLAPAVVDRIVRERG
ncbi:hypothetical protein [Haloarcula halophila]|uniref:hypothetical protein n=1 Tax=Haloarcula TaxID=2237 RepID=UPI0023E44C78|nr:hypothetical protein [Halomicroarcula sp. DFY41]